MDRWDDDDHLVSEALQKRVGSAAASSSAHSRANSSSAAVAEDNRSIADDSNSEKADYSFDVIALSPKQQHQQLPSFIRRPRSTSSSQQTHNSVPKQELQTEVADEATEFAKWVDSNRQPRSKSASAAFSRAFAPSKAFVPKTPQGRIVPGQKSIQNPLQKKNATIKSTANIYGETRQPAAVAVAAASGSMTLRQSSSSVQSSYAQKRSSSAQTSSFRRNESTGWNDRPSVGIPTYDATKDKHCRSVVKVLKPQKSRQQQQQGQRYLDGSQMSSVTMDGTTMSTSNEDGGEDKLVSEELLQPTATKRAQLNTAIRDDLMNLEEEIQNVLSDEQRHRQPRQLGAAAVVAATPSPTAAAAGTAVAASSSFQNTLSQRSTTSMLLQKTKSVYAAAVPVPQPQRPQQQSQPQPRRNNAWNDASSDSSSPQNYFSGESSYSDARLQNIQQQALLRARRELDERIKSDREMREKLIRQLRQKIKQEETKRKEIETLTAEKDQKLLALRSELEKAQKTAQAAQRQANTQQQAIPTDLKKKLTELAQDNRNLRDELRLIKQQQAIIEESKSLVGNIDFASSSSQGNSSASERFSKEQLNEELARVRKKLAAEQKKLTDALQQLKAQEKLQESNVKLTAYLERERSEKEKFIKEQKKLMERAEAFKSVAGQSALLEQRYERRTRQLQGEIGLLRQALSDKEQHQHALELQIHEQKARTKEIEVKLVETQRTVKLHQEAESEEQQNLRRVLVRLGDLERDKLSLEEHNRQLRQDLEKQKEHNDAVKKECAEWEREVVKLRKGQLHETDSTRAELTRLTAQISKLESKVQELTAKHDRLKSENESMHSNSSTLQHELEVERRKREDIESQRAELVEQHRRDMEKLTQRWQESEDRCSALSQTNMTLLQRVKTLQDQQKQR